MSVEFKARVVLMLQNEAKDPVYSSETRAKLASAAAEVKAGTLAPEQASNVSLGASFELIRAFQTGEAFSASVPVETRKARESYLLEQVDKLIPRLRQSGLTSALSALEGARAANDFASLGRTYVNATAKNVEADLDRDLDQQIAQHSAGITRS